MNRYYMEVATYDFLKTPDTAKVSKANTTAETEPEARRKALDIAYELQLFVKTIRVLGHKPLENYNG